MPIAKPHENEKQDDFISHCACGCGKETKGSRFIHGHNRRRYPGTITQGDYQRVWRQENKKYVNKVQNEYRANNSEKVKKWLKNRQLKKYGISEDQYNEFIEKQKGLCPICGDALTDGYDLCIDHDHKAGEVRGLLHRKCNMWLGFYEQFPCVFERMNNYLGGKVNANT